MGPRRRHRDGCHGPHGAAVINGKIFISGGRKNGRPYNPPSAQSYMYDPGTDTWTRKQNMPDGGDQGFTGLIAGKLYVLCRCLEPVTPMDYWYDDCWDPPRANFFRYNRVKDQWTTLPSPANTYTTGGAAGVIGGKFYVEGGTSLEVYAGHQSLGRQEAAASFSRIFPDRHGGQREAVRVRRAGAQPASS